MTSGDLFSTRNRTHRQRRPRVAAGELDLATAPELVQALADATAQQPGNLLLDLERDHLHRLERPARAAGVCPPGPWQARDRPEQPAHPPCAGRRSERVAPVHRLVARASGRARRVRLTGSGAAVADRDRSRLQRAQRRPFERDDLAHLGRVAGGARWEHERAGDGRRRKAGVVQAARGGDHHGVGHGGQIAQRLVAVLTLAEVDLGERVGAGDPGNVDEVGDLDPVAGGKVKITEVLGVRCDLAREGLVEHGQMWDVEVEEWPRNELGDASTLIWKDGRTGVERPPERALDEPDLAVRQNRSEQADDKVRGEGTRVSVSSRKTTISLSTALSARHIASPLPRETPWSLSR